MLKRNDFKEIISGMFAIIIFLAFGSAMISSSAISININGIISGIFGIGLLIIVIALIAKIFKIFKISVKY